tara:strand:+ start:293 stop:454 length:162 start_codon:yes stop_codon:yes gene_type:complete
MRIEDNEYARLCKALSDYAERNKWPHTKYHDWLRKYTDSHTFASEVKKLIGEM